MPAESRKLPAMMLWLLIPKTKVEAGAALGGGGTGTNVAAWDSVGSATPATQSKSPLKKCMMLFPSFCATARADANRELRVAMLTTARALRKVMRWRTASRRAISDLLHSGFIPRLTDQMNVYARARYREGILESGICTRFGKLRI